MRAFALFVGIAATAALVGAARAIPSVRPAPGAKDVCPDTPLRIVLDRPDDLPAGSRFEVVDTGSGATVASIAQDAGPAVKTIGGLPGWHYYPVLSFGREVDVFLPAPLAYGHSYRVTVAGLPTPLTWEFSTRAAPPPSASSRLVVSADGDGDFATVQGALDFIPAGNTAPRTIFIQRGFYPEIVYFADKDAIELVGEDRQETVIGYPNNARFNNVHGSYHRGLLTAARTHDLHLHHLTLRNTTPPGGSQAEAIILEGGPNARSVVEDVDLYSYQDTLQINGQAYVHDSHIVGDVDFLWGTGPCYFERCELTSLRSGAYYTQIRNPASHHGYVFRDCRFDGAPGVMGNYLARIEPGRFPASEVVLIDCALGPSVGPAAWMLQGANGPVDQLRFYEAGSRGFDGKPIETALRMPGSKRLGDARGYRDIKAILGGSWDPSPPARETAAHPPPAPTLAGANRAAYALRGTDVRLVARQPASVYVWRKNGRVIPGEYGRALWLHSVLSADAGGYTARPFRNGSDPAARSDFQVIVTAPSTPTPPKLPQIPAREFSVLEAGALGDGLTDNTGAFQSTIDRAAARGGGRVIVPAAAAPYLCGPIALKSGIDLQIDEGAVIRILPRRGPHAYPLGGARYANFLTGDGLHDVAITGAGTIDGDGAPWWDAFRDDPDMPHRPFLVRIDDSERVLVSGLHLENSPMFHLALGRVNQLTVFDVHIHARGISPNTDGIDPSGEHQLIQNCQVSVGDDNVAIKAGGAFCSDITVSDCEFGDGHGVSVGGQSTRGLDGLTVKNCSFTGTGSALRLKADPTQGGNVRNVSYTNLAMDRVSFPIVFYSYYNRSGNPGSMRGSNATTPDKVRAWNERPPNSLASARLPTWRNITLSHITSTNTGGRSIIWGLPLAAGLIQGVTLSDVRILGGGGMGIYDATEVRFERGTAISPVSAYNALALIQSPHLTKPGMLEVAAVGGSGARRAALAYQWLRNGQPISGATGPQFHFEAGKPADYSVTVSTQLDGFDVSTRHLVPASLPETITARASP